MTLRVIAGVREDGAEQPDAEGSTQSPEREWRCVPEGRVSVHSIAALAQGGSRIVGRICWPWFKLYFPDICLRR